MEFISPGPDSTAELIRTLADAEHRDLIVRTLEKVEGMSLEALEAGLGTAWPFETFPQYLDTLEKQGSSINIAALFGGKAVAEKRRFVKGLRVNLDTDTPIASLVLKDTGEEASAIHIHDRDNEVAEPDARAADAAACADDACAGGADACAGAWVEACAAAGATRARARTTVSASGSMSVNVAAWGMTGALAASVLASNMSDRACRLLGWATASLRLRAISAMDCSDIASEIGWVAVFTYDSSACVSASMPVAAASVGLRRTFTRAVLMGKSAAEFEPKGKAAAEMAALMDEVLA